MSFTGRTLFVLFSLCWSFPFLASANVSYFVPNPNFERNYLVEGDSVNPTRNSAEVSQNAWIAVEGEHQGSYRFRAELQSQVDGEWKTVALEGEDDFMISETEQVDALNELVILYFGYKFTPEGILDPYTNYRVQGQFQRLDFVDGPGDFPIPVWVNVEDPGTRTSNLYHFTNEDSEDDAFNAITTLDSISMANRFALTEASNTSDQGFQVDIEATIRRWDAFDEAPQSNPTILRYEFEIIDPDTGETVALRQDVASSVVSIPSYDDSDSWPVPSVTPVTFTANIRPDEQLDPTRDDYIINITATHREETNPTVYQTGNTLSLEEERLIHFSGALEFDDIETIMSSFEQEPEPSFTSFGSYLTMDLTEVEGAFAMSDGHTFDTGSDSMNVRLFPDGTTEVQSVEDTIEVVPSETPDIGKAGSVRFGRGGLELEADGLSGILTAILPQGMGYTFDPDQGREYQGFLSFGRNDLGNDLGPTQNEYVFANTVFVSEETKPALIAASSITWNVAQEDFSIEHNAALGSDGVRYTRWEETLQLEMSAVPENQRQKRSNTGYYFALTGIQESVFTVTTSQNGAARLNVGFSFGEGSFQTHFPYGAHISFSQGEATISENLVESGSLSGVEPVFVPYTQDCADVDCDQEDPRNGAFLVDVGGLDFTTDGGLIGNGDLLDEGKDVSRVLRWGYIDALSGDRDVFAHELDEFTQGSFHMSGHFITGDGGPDEPDHGPGSILLAASDSSGELGRPGSTADLEGDGDYAGVNLRAENESTILGLAVIAGKEVDYTVRDCNKFYVRSGGVTGTLEAEPGTFPETLELLGYTFNFSYYGLGFIDSVTSKERSFTEGDMEVIYPTQESFAFDGLAFDCLGGLDEARLPDGGLESFFVYWAADVDVHSLSFVSSDSCDPSADAFAALGSTAYSTPMVEAVHGVLGVRPDGNLIDREFSRERGLETELTSRLRMPSAVGLNGPEEEVYEMTPISDAYFNSYERSNEDSSGDGRINYAVKINVPFFEDLSAHVRTTAFRNTNPDALFDLMGGWTETIDEEELTYFNAEYFDPFNRAYPEGVEESVYRNESGDEEDRKPYLIRARQEWLNVIELEYVLDWSSTLRSFTSFKPTQDTDLLVVTVDHQLEYLSAENAEISFGIMYEGLPRINMTNFAVNKVEEGTGTLQAITESLQEEAVGALEAGLNGIDSLLDDKAEELLETVLKNTADPVIDELYGELVDLADSTDDASEWADGVSERLEEFILGTAGSAENTLLDVFIQMSQPLEEANSLVETTDDRLRQLQGALRTIHGQIYVIDGEVAIDPPEVGSPDETLNGLLYLEEEGAKYEIVNNLVARLIDEVAGDLGADLANMLNDSLSDLTGELNDLVNEQIENVRPTLERVQEILADLDERVGQVREKLADGGEIVEELQAIILAAEEEIEEAMEKVTEEVEDFFVTGSPEPSLFEEYTEEEFKELIRGELKDRLAELDFVREYQKVFRQHLQDIDLAIKEGIDTAFAQVNNILRNLLQDYLSDVDDSINGLLGDVDDVIGAGDLDGFVHITGDRLSLLRLDAYLQLMVPDEFEFNGYFQIQQFESDGQGSCEFTAPGTLAKEVSLGASEVPVEWISPGMAVDVGTKFSFDENTALKGLAGSLEMTEGEFNFEAFTVTDLGAAVAFGATENYFAAKVGMIFQEYTLAGGVFFGRTCTIEPLEIVDPDVAGVLGEPDPTFSGAYVYGEAHIPVSEALLGIPASCVFQISAGVGAGAFFFVEGPTYGGQMLLAVSGDALCLFSISGEVSLIGAKTGDDLRFNGQGTLSGSVGKCSRFCIKLSKTLELEYANDRWSYDF
ncbi:MAG: hypothetical protein LAT58_01040 [Opitutales bacterium]|nr:hypothetical protein [Opitutales bacterium]